MLLPQDNDDVACDKLIKGLYKINKDFEVPSMKNFGINQKNFEEELENMATDAENSGAPNLNPRVPSVNEMVRSLRTSMESILNMSWRCTSFKINTQNKREGKYDR